MLMTTIIEVALRPLGEEDIRRRKGIVRQYDMLVLVVSSSSLYSDFGFRRIRSRPDVPPNNPAQPGEPEVAGTSAADHYDTHHYHQQHHHHEDDPGSFCHEVPYYKDCDHDQYSFDDISTRS